MWTNVNIKKNTNSPSKQKTTLVTLLQQSVLSILLTVKSNQVIIFFTTRKIKKQALAEFAEANLNEQVCTFPVIREATCVDPEKGGNMWRSRMRVGSPEYSGFCSGHTRFLVDPKALSPPPSSSLHLRAALDRNGTGMVRKNEAKVRSPTFELGCCYVK